MTPNDEQRYHLGDPVHGSRDHHQTRGPRKLGPAGALASSSSYRRTVREPEKGDLLAGEQSEEVFEVEDRNLRPEALLGALGS